MKKISIIICAIIFSFTAFSVGGCALFGGEEEPYGVATTSVVICDILDKLDCDKVVGIPITEDDIPARYADAEKIGAPMEPDMEIVKKINPEVILVPVSLKTSLDAQFKAININVMYINLSDVEEMYNDILELGELLGAQDKAQTLYDGYTGYMASYPTSETEISVLTIMAFNGLFIVAAEDSYVGNLVKLAGGKNVYPTGYVTDGTGMISVSVEDLAQKNPDVILIFAHFNEEQAFAYMREELKGTVWSNFAAVQNDEVYYLSTDDGFGVSANLSWTDALETLKPIFYGE